MCVHGACTATIAALACATCGHARAKHVHTAPSMFTLLRSALHTLRCRSRISSTSSRHQKSIDDHGECLWSEPHSPSCCSSSQQLIVRGVVYVAGTVAVTCKHDGKQQQVLVRCV
jgi:hypothetical protein